MVAWDATIFLGKPDLVRGAVTNVSAVILVVVWQLFHILARGAGCGNRRENKSVLEKL